LYITQVNVLFTEMYMNNEHGAATYANISYTRK